ncbi:uncharacterized protein LTR77_008143 [Saxophila tyrrhenica]|uniref:Uncharacterized protein n=1 Tax=Saxophila tyrrhenica TaxID=1690608 RepID=A0AAV9P3X6_9PEZI|nr:hypothetical protein LTR77_008143 [Saxophila tyrrhenica]
MSNLCTRCALRLQRAAAAPSHTTTTRSLSTTPIRPKALPTFQSTSSPELDDILSTFRSKHIIPRMLSNHDRNLIFSLKTRKYLEENPQTVTIGDEDIDLQWIDQRTEIPNRREMMWQTMRLMREGEPGDWNNLPALLEGLAKVKRGANERQMAKMVRLASERGRFGIVLQCLHQARRTGMTLRREEVLNAVVWALREMGRAGVNVEGGEVDRGSWERAGLEKAIKDANEIAVLLEEPEHGTGNIVRQGDPRTRPEVLSVFLELNAAYAYRFQDGKDVDGKVRAYTDRLLANIKGAEGPATIEPASTGPQTEMLRGMPIWHGLQLAQKILGNQIPQPDLVKQVTSAWEEGLEALSSKIQAGDVEEGSYAAQALKVWKDCIRE